MDKGPAGFTLIELLWVAVLWVLLASVSMPLLSRALQSWARTAGAEDLLALMGWARERAIMEQRDYGIHVDVAKKAYWLVRRDEEGFENGFSRIPEKWGRTRPLPLDVDLRSDEAVVLFHPNGTATPWSMDWTARDGQVFRIQVDPVLGKGSAYERAS